MEMPQKINTEQRFSRHRNLPRRETNANNLSFSWLEKNNAPDSIPVAKKSELGDRALWVGPIRATIAEAWFCPVANIRRDFMGMQFAK